MDKFFGWVEYELANTSAAIFMTRVVTWAKIPGAKKYRFQPDFEKDGHLSLVAQRC